MSKFSDIMLSPNWRQVAFSEAYKCLAEQGFQRSVRETPVSSKVACAYRGKDGMKCAVGHLLDDDDITMLRDTGVGIEGSAANQVLTRMCNIRPEVKSRLLQDNDWRAGVFLDGLQRAHDDSSSPAGMKQRLQGFANRWSLQVPEVSA